LKEQPLISPYSLIIMNDNIGTTRLAGGTYLMQIKLFGKPYLLLNPFHAYQLVPYTTSGHAIIAFECLSKLSWEHLRNKICGVTDPKLAAEGSLRNLFLNAKDTLGLGDVDKGSNGVHMSAGPLEGMVELQRFLTDHEVSHEKLGFEQLAFGALLAKSLSLDRIKELGTNPVLSIEGKNVSAFDATEEKDAEEAAAILAKL